MSPLQATARPALAAASALLLAAGCSVVLDPGGFVGPGIDSGAPSDASSVDAFVPDGETPDARVLPDGGCETCGGATCVDLQSDRDHCGRCDASCGDFEACSSAICAGVDLASIRSADAVSIRAVAVRTDGTVCVTGELGGSYTVFRGETVEEARGMANVQNAFLACFRGNGTLQWLQVLASGGTSTGRAIALGASEVVVVGSYSSGLYVDGMVLPAAGGSADGFIARFSRAGVALSAERVSGPGRDDVAAVALHDSRLCYGGTFEGTVQMPDATGPRAFTSEGGADAFITCRDRGMDRTITFGTPGFDEVKTLATSASHVIVGGAFSGTLPPALGGLSSAGAGDGVLLWFDTALAPVAQRRLGGDGPDFVSSIAMTPTGVVIAAGGCSGADALPTSPALSCDAGIDGFVAAYDMATASPLWARRIGGAGFQGALAVAVDPGGRAWVGGQFIGNSSFDDGTMLSPIGDGDEAFIASFDPTGALQRRAAWGGLGPDRVLGAAWDPARSAPVFVGEYQDRVSILGSDLAGGGDYDGVIIRLPGPL